MKSTSPLRSAMVAPVWGWSASQPSDQTGVWGRRLPMLQKSGPDSATALTGSDPGPSEYVFPVGLDSHIPTRPQSLSNRWMSIRGASSVTLLHLRHFAATTMLDAGQSYRTVAEILGHRRVDAALPPPGSYVGKRLALRCAGDRRLMSRVHGLLHPEPGSQACRRLPATAVGELKHWDCRGFYQERDQ